MATNFQWHIVHGNHLSSYIISSSGCPFHPSIPSSVPSSIHPSSSSQKKKMMADFTVSEGHGYPLVSKWIASELSNGMYQKGHEVSNATTIHNVIGLSPPLSKVIPTLVYIREPLVMSALGSCMYNKSSFKLLWWCCVLLPISWKKNLHKTLSKPLTPFHCQHPPMLMMQRFHSLTHWTSLWTFPSSFNLMAIGNTYEIIYDMGTTLGKVWWELEH